jgi:HD superfamily phosphohydrolase
MARFSDSLYGEISLPNWIEPFIRLPEFVRLRGVRLSNVDSIQFKDFGNATRWEHGIAVAHLARACAAKKELTLLESTHLILAGLLHDVATPPFAHSAEAVLEGFDHELETQRLLTDTPSLNAAPSQTVLNSALPRFRRECERLTRAIKVKVDPDEIARMVVGEGALGFLIAGTLDLDNADNVTRGCRYMGFNPDPQVPLNVAFWLARQNSAPTDLAEVDDPAVRTWMDYRARYYRAFYEATDEEFAREALLQHIMRRAIDEGLPRRTLVWTTDDSLLSTVARLSSELTPSWISFEEIVERYRLMESLQVVFTAEIDDDAVLRSIGHPEAIRWIERELSSDELETCVLLSARRFGDSPSPSLFPPAVGVLRAFKLGVELQYHHLPAWAKPRISSHLSGGRLRKAFAAATGKALRGWATEKPWLSPTPKRRIRVVENLKAIGDWSFRLSRNEGLHAYPSTFVHAIPSALIGALGVGTELVLDPFGGTGQTAAETLRHGGTAISADVNTIATLVAQARFSPISPRQRRCLSKISIDDLSSARAIDPPEFELRSKWHHPRTLSELCQLRGFIDGQKDAVVKQFLMATFSSIITATTARRGLEHGFFADNTPLPASLGRPPYQDAFDLFISKLDRNLRVINRFYAGIERGGRVPSNELKRVSVLRADVRTAEPTDYGVEPNSVAAIITSPPYLCMTDYTLGQRLSYYWIAPANLTADFEAEIGARRRRSQRSNAARQYFTDLERFILLARNTIRQGGFLATVLGEPVAERFKNAGVVDTFDRLAKAAGFERMWDQWRPIHWHRNQGYRRLMKERVAVHVFRG